MSANVKKCLYVEKGSCGKDTESSDLQCLLCIGSGLSRSSIALVRSVAQASIRIDEAGTVLDAMERINRFLNGHYKLIKQKYLDKEEFKEMVEAFGKIENTEVGERIKHQFKSKTE